MSSFNTFWSRGNVFLAASFALMTICGCGGYNDGLKKYPVSGSLTIDGDPMSGVVVRLTSTDASVEGNARYPVGVTDDEGRFTLSTNCEADGAVAGEYDVTIIWPVSNDPPLLDRLGGAYSTPQKSKLHVTVTTGENHLEPFSLVRKKGTVETRPASRLDIEG